MQKFFFVQPSDIKVEETSQTEKKENSQHIID